MREIKFRGKKEGSRVWDYGDLAKDKEGTSFIVDVAKDNIGYIAYLREIDPKTIGQYTGLEDKNGVEIYEGDIVCSKYGDKIIDIGDVQFDCGVFGVEWIHNKKNRNMVWSWGQRHNLRKLDDDLINEIEVIGNIYDNPELLEVEE